MRKNYGPHLACVPSASRPLAVFGFLILGEIVHVTGCAVLKIGLKKMKDSVRKLRQLS
jgi:hypothetical protein